MTDDQWREGVNKRLSDIEARMMSVERKAAVDEVHRQNVESRLGGIEGTLQKLMWLVIAALVAAVMNFVISGGVVP